MENSLLVVWGLFTGVNVGVGNTGRLPSRFAHLFFPAMVRSLFMRNTPNKYKSTSTRKLQQIIETVLLFDFKCSSRVENY